MSLKKRRRSSSSPNQNRDAIDSNSQIYVSSPIKDRSSTFIAHYSPSLPAGTLQAQAEISSATHRIAAWRKQSTQRSLSTTAPLLYDTGSDDDGEKYAGKKLEKVLGEMNVPGAVVVARWYGGILLGPVRFSHIENCAREAIGKWIQESRNVAVDESSKKRRVEADEEERKRLVEELGERDSHITILRQLLDEKRGVKSSQGDDAGVIAPTPEKKAPDYTKMPLDALKQLEKVRDATIAFLLKSIDKAEEDQKKTREKDTLDAS